MSAPALSVLMPVLNPHPEYFPRAVRSVLQQSFGDFELIITEDPGDSAAAPLLARFDDPRIIHQRNETRTRLIVQRNQGIQTARAPLIALVDSDDICEPQRFERQLAFLQQNSDVDVVSSHLTIIDTEDRVVGYRRYPTDHESIMAALPLYNPIAQPAVMFRRDKVRMQGGYTYQSYNVNSDYDLWCRLANTGARFAVLNEPLVRYRIHPGGLKSAKLRDVIAATIDIKKQHMAHRMTLKAHARLLAERALLTLPPSVVLKLFMKMQYRKTLDAS